MVNVLLLKELDLGHCREYTVIIQEMVKERQTHSTRKQGKN